MQKIHHTTIIKVGNSKGIRIPKEYLNGLGEKVIIQSAKQGILIRPDKGQAIPPLKEWDKLFAKAIAAGEKPESDFFEGMQNQSDKNEWTWD